MKTVKYLFLFPCLLAACASGPGSGWGEITGEISTGFEPSAEYLSEDGRLRTDRGYLIRVDELEFEPVSVSLRTFEGATGGSVDFDPANPPPGYSNCHGGHCHAEDGSLPSYEEIRRDLAGGGQTERTLVTFPAPQPSLEGTASVPIDESHCVPSCSIDEITSLDAAVLSVGHLHVRGVAEGPDSGNGSSEGVDFAAEIPLDTTLRETLHVTFGPDSSAVVELHGHFALTEHLFDGIEWSEAVTDGALSEEAVAQIRENFTASAWHVDVEGASEDEHDGPDEDVHDHEDDDGHAH